MKAEKEEEITIVVPVYNRASLIGRTLDSIYAQRHRPLRVIVVDNDSSDDSVATIRQWAESKFLSSRQQANPPAEYEDIQGFSLEIMHESRRGAAIARNRGLSAVTTEWVLFFDSDDEMHPDLVGAALSKSEDADVVYWKAERILLNGTHYQMPFTTTRMAEQHLYRSLFSTQTYMIRTSIIRALGGWDESTKVWDDWELGWRILLAAPRYVSLPRLLVTIHAQADSLTGTGYLHRRGDWEHAISLMRNETEKYHHRNLLPTYINYQKAMAMLDYRSAMLGAYYRREGEKEKGEALLEATLAQSSLSSWRKAQLRLLYHYTALGGRGAYRLWI